MTTRAPSVIPVSIPDTLVPVIREKKRMAARTAASPPASCPSRRLPESGETRERVPETSRTGSRRAGSSPAPLLPGKKRRTEIQTRLVSVRRPRPDCRECCRSNGKRRIRLPAMIETISAKRELIRKGKAREKTVRDRKVAPARSGIQSMGRSGLAKCTREAGSKRPKARRIPARIEKSSRKVRRSGLPGATRRTPRSKINVSRKGPKARSIKVRAGTMASVSIFFSDDRIEPGLSTGAGAEARPCQS
jgi:hypothetical protein